MDSSSKREQKEMRRAAQDRKNNLIAILFGLPFLAAGLGLSIYFGMAALAGMQPLQWRRVPCTIVSSSVRRMGR